MTTTKKPALKDSKPVTGKRGWLDDLPASMETATAATFPAPETFFLHTVTSRPPGGAVASTNGKIPATESTPTVVRMPDALRARLNENTVGPTTNVIVALVDWALDQLTQNRQALVSHNREKK